MAAVYVGFKLASNHDISRYTICEGRRVEVDPHGVPREYMYTVCPSHLRYCCRSELYDGERCCAGRSYYSYSQPQGRIIGSLFGTLLMILGIGLLAYFFCLRRRRKQSSSMHDMPAPPPPPPNFVTVGGYAPALDPRVPTYPVPVSKSDPYLDPPPPYPASVPSGIQPPPYPGETPPVPNPPYPASSNPVLGSGWGAAPQHPPPPTAPSGWRLLPGYALDGVGLISLAAVFATRRGGGSLLSGERAVVGSRLNEKLAGVVVDPILRESF
ncbi:hypothetical protein EGR_10205 [Echinococcus granulosus]|uniref:Uncharacterized protein n=1 Tax=Echinococcus granulosus TaxID=6210 RepID=W6U1J1_ECHGR|nr:hypothetical protein EGR_10205 [Echinococcus granulosus]EUB54923.1 hypothetical protein EGR_10205 [Echinococcus granulosus]